MVISQMSLYHFADLDECLVRGHEFRLTHSDKKPLRFNMQCIDCTIERHATVYVAYSEEKLSFGRWAEMCKRELLDERPEEK